MVLDNAAGATFRADINNALLALISNSSGASAPGTTYAYQFWADTTTGLLKLRNAANSAWITVGTLASANLGHALTGDIQSQTYTAFTTGGTSSAFTLTPTPSSAANAAKQQYTAPLHAAPTGSPTIAVSGLPPLNFKYWDAAGTKQFVTAAQAPINHPAVVYNDGTDWMLLNPLPMHGYGAGSGGTVTQLTDKSTAVTLNKATGLITTHNAALAANTTALFTVNNSVVVATDLVNVMIADGNGGNYNVWAYAVNAGNFAIALRNITAGSLSHALPIRFEIVRSVNS